VRYINGKLFFSVFQPYFGQHVEVCVEKATTKCTKKCGGGSGLRGF
jgi:hypothetical protein